MQKWSRSCSEEIEEKVRGSFGQRMPQIGRKPRCKILTDSATWQHRTREVTGLVKVTPDSAELIKAYFITSTWSPGGSGREKAKEIVAGVDKFITAEQYQGLSADGHQC